MPYAIVLYFDQPSETSIRTIWANLAKDAITADISNSGIRPHLTLAIYDELRCQPCEMELEKFAAQTSHLKIQADHIGVFYKPDITLFLAPTPTKRLLGFQASIHKNLSGKVTNSWKMYQPGNWVPHCTIAMDLDLEQLSKAVISSAAIQMPVNLHATQIGAVEFLPVSELFSYNLKHI